MEFNELVFKTLGKIFQEYNLLVKEQFRNHVELHSPKVVLSLSFDVRENSILIEVGTDEDSLNPVDTKVIKAVFNEEIDLNCANEKDLVSNLAKFFKGKGKKLLVGDLPSLNAVKEYVNTVSEKYTGHLVQMQILDVADKAWNKGNYKQFLEYHEKTDISKLPSSYKLKYEIARRKVRLS